MSIGAHGLALKGICSQLQMSRDMTKPTKWVCAQRRSAWASAQSDQSLRCALNGKLRTRCFFMRTAKTLIRLGGCPGLSQFSLGAHSFCWFCHVAAQIKSNNHTKALLLFIVYVSYYEPFTWIGSKFLIRLTVKSDQKEEKKKGRKEEKRNDWLVIN